VQEDRWEREVATGLGSIRKGTKNLNPFTVFKNQGKPYMKGKERKVEPWSHRKEKEGGAWKSLKKVSEPQYCVPHSLGASKYL